MSDDNSTHSINSEDSVFLNETWVRYSVDQNQKDKILFSALELIGTDILMDLRIDTTKETIQLTNDLFVKKLKITRTDAFLEMLDLSECEHKEYSAMCRIEKRINNDINDIIAKGQTIYIDKFTFHKEFRNCSLEYISENMGNVIYEYSVCEEQRINSFDTSTNILIGSFELN